jgi:ribosomal protein L28
MFIFLFHHRRTNPLGRSETRARKYYGYARLFTIYEGTSEIQRIVISNNILKDKRGRLLVLGRHWKAFNLVTSTLIIGPDGSQYRMTVTGIAIMRMIRIVAFSG